MRSVRESPQSRPHQAKSRAVTPLQRGWTWNPRNEMVQCLHSNDLRGLRILDMPNFEPGTLMFLEAPSRLWAPGLLLKARAWLYVLLLTVLPQDLMELLQADRGKTGKEAARFTSKSGRASVSPCQLYSQQGKHIHSRYLGEPWSLERGR